MKNSIKVITENNKEVEIEIITSFKIEEINKEYIVYSLNDDGISDDVMIFISEIQYLNDKPKIVSINEKEKEMVLLFYNNLKESL